MHTEDMGLEGIYLLDLPSDAYRGQEAARMIIEVPESLVDERVESLLEQVSWRELADAPIESGDRLCLELEGTIASERIGPIEARMRVGSGEFIPEFEEALIGCRVNETLHLVLPMPVPFVCEEWEGKRAEVRVSIDSAYRFSEYVLTDEYVAHVSDFRSVQELKDAIRSQFEAEATQESERLLMAQLAEVISKPVRERLSDDDLLYFALSSPDHGHLEEVSLSDAARQQLVEEAAFEIAWRNIARKESIDESEEADRLLAAMETSAELDADTRVAAWECVRDEATCAKVMDLVLSATNISQVGA